MTKTHHDHEPNSNKAKRSRRNANRNAQLPYEPRPTDDGEKRWYFTWNQRRRSFYMPHQGERERARRFAQAKLRLMRTAIRGRIRMGLDLTDELLLDAKMKPPADYRRAPTGDYWYKPYAPFAGTVVNPHLTDKFKFEYHHPFMAFRPTPT